MAQDEHTEESTRAEGAGTDDRVQDPTQDEAALWAEFEQAETNNPDAPLEEGAQSAEGEEAPERGGADDWPDGAPPSGETPSDDVWANASPAQRAAYEAAQKSVSGLREQLDRRLREINRLKSEHLHAQQRAPTTPAASSEAAQGETAQGEPTQADPAEGFLVSPKWKDFAEEYPEVAGPLADVIGGLQAHTSRLEKELSAIGIERRQSALAEQAALLADEHPDWEQAVADRGFVEWLQGQPRHIQEAAYRNAEHIVDAAEAADVVGRFKASRGGGNNAPTNTPGPNGQGTGTHQALAGKRARQLESASAARSRGPGAASGIPEDGDPETIWRQFEELERRQQARR